MIRSEIVRGQRETALLRELASPMEHGAKLAVCCSVAP